MPTRSSGFRGCPKDSLAAFTVRLMGLILPPTESVSTLRIQTPVTMNFWCGTFKEQLYLIDTNRQKLQGELESKFPKFAERLFSHDFCTMEDDLEISMKLAKWSKPGCHPSTQLYTIGDRFSTLDSIPSTLEPYKPLMREEVGISSQEGESTYLDGWQNYLKQRSYPKPT